MQINRQVLDSAESPSLALVSEDSFKKLMELVKYEWEHFEM